MHTFANRFRSTTWCHHRTCVARCNRCHRSTVARLQAIEPLLETLGFVSQPEQVALLVPGQPVVQPCTVEPAQLAQVGTVKIAEVRTGTYRSVVQPAVAHRIGRCRLSNRVQSFLSEIFGFNTRRWSSPSYERRPPIAPRRTTAPTMERIKTRLSSSSSSASTPSLLPLDRLRLRNNDLVNHMDNAVRSRRQQW